MEAPRPELVNVQLPEGWRELPPGRRPKASCFAAEGPGGRSLDVEEILPGRWMVSAAVGDVRMEICLPEGAPLAAAMPLAMAFCELGRVPGA